MMDNSNINTFPLVALRGLVIFPYVIASFEVGRETTKNAIDYAQRNNGLIFLVSQKDEKIENVTSDDIFSLGVIAKIRQVISLNSSNLKVVVEGVSRAEILDFVQTEPFITVQVHEYYEQLAGDDSGISALGVKCEELFTKYASAAENVPPEAVMGLAGLDDIGQIADVMASALTAPVEDKQEILECVDIKERLMKLAECLARELEIAEIERDVEEKVKNILDERQREYFLREQIRVIKDELGESSYDDADEADELTEKLNAAKLPDNVREKLQKEIDKMRRTPPGMGENAITRNYVEYVLELPWCEKTAENSNLAKAEKILNGDHYGLEKVKKRIIETLAVMKLTDNVQSSILCLAGPPGVGKTSVARSIARSMNRKYVRISLGGVRDEADIRGHRKTYIGAMAGRIMSALKEAGTSNPVILLDEIDKIGSDMRGDPSAALLEVLDSEQNTAFKDHYVELPFDLSDVMFICTANTLDTVDRPLLDRLEVIDIAGYTAEDKLAIAKKYLIPKQLEKHGLGKANLKITDGAVSDIIEYYTREMGVRNLERSIAAICRKTAAEIVKNKKKSIKITSAELTDMLGEKIFSYETAGGNNIVGVATGLAWTQLGGDTLSIEVNIMDGSGKVELTGQLGDVMKESASAAISYIRANAEVLGVKKDFYKTKDIHLHVPEGATPKDGPSAGITIATAIVSALTDNPVRSDVAMTGEITIRGRVLPIGGLKEKSLAAYRSGIKTIVIPQKNKKDLKELPEKVREGISFVCAEEIGTVLKTALENPPRERKIQEHPMPIRQQDAGVRCIENM